MEKLQKNLILSIDQGTTGTTVMLIDRDLIVKAKATRDYPQHYPKPGWVEHNPEEIWQSTLNAIEDAIAIAARDGGVPDAQTASKPTTQDARGDTNQDAIKHAIAAIGITNQRETTVIWDRKSGKPIHNAIVWQCRRTAERCRDLRDMGHADTLFKKTGLVLDAYFSATKIEWLLDHVPNARQQAEAGALAFGTIDTFLVSRLTGGTVHVTDVSNASRTMLMNLETLAWDDDLLRLFSVPHAILPKIASNAEIYGHTNGVPGLPDGIPIAGMAGDQQAALFGQACFDLGDAKCTYGTGAFVLLNTGSTIRHSTNKLLTTVAWQLNGTTTYALEGSAFIAGAAVQWLRDGLGIIKHSHEIEALAESVPDSGGVSFVPALAGLGAPYWNPDARGVIHGLTRGTTKAHIARATLDGIAHEVADLLDAMTADLGHPLKTLKVDGGASANALLMQTEADLIGTAVIRPKMIETTAFGAAFLAGLGVGLFHSQEEIRRVWQQDRVFTRTLPESEALARRAQWKEVVKKA